MHQQTKKRRRGCHKDSFVSVLAVALAAAKKIEAKGWMDE